MNGDSLAKFNKGSGEWFLVILATVADLLSILSYLGIQSSGQVKTAISAGLCLIALTAAGSTLLGWIRLWFSPRGSYYPNTLHIKRLVLGVLAILVAVVFGIYVVTNLHHQPSNHRNKKTHAAPITTASAVNINHVPAQFQVYCLNSAQ